MATEALYPMTVSSTFDQVPGSLPGDLVADNVDLTSFPLLAQEVLWDFSTASLDTNALWRDFFALTGRLRTFNGSEQIVNKWEVAKTGKVLRGWKMDEARVSRPTPISSWIDVSFTFVVEGAEEEGRAGGETESGLRRNCFGILSFVPGDEGHGWKVWMLRTMLENFEGYGHPDDSTPIFSKSLPPASPSTEEDVFEVIIIGAGQAGLSLAGRLHALGIKNLLLEKESEVGSSWTSKYDSVIQHTVRELNNLPFDRTYKAEDPILLPAKIVAEGFRNYVEKYKINVWLNAQTEKCIKTTDGGWELKVRVGEKVTVLHAKHLVLAIGGGVSVPTAPDIPGREKFKGDVLDLSIYKNCYPWSGKKGIVVGAGTGAHDAAQDMLNAGLSTVTMIQRGKTPVYPVERIVQGQSMLYNTDIPTTEADRLVSLMPLKIEREMMRVNLGGLVAAHSKHFDELEKSGFRVDREAVLTDHLQLRGGGYYIDVGTSKRIAAGDIKVKSGIKIKSFTTKGLVFDDEEEVEDDVVVFATGYESDVRVQAAAIVGHEIARTLPQYRILSPEGELSGPLNPAGERLWLMRGPVSDARFQSRFIALQIQATLLGKSLPDCQWSGFGESKFKL